MKYFLDTEFYEDGKTIDLISIGIVSEKGEEFYAVNADFNWSRPWMPADYAKSAWVRDNVLTYIDRVVAIPAVEIREAIQQFITWPDCEDWTVKPEFWGYYAASDWVAFYQLWGRLIDLPDYFPKWCRDIKQLQADLGNPQLPFDPKIHHALEDAKWQKSAYDFLVEYAKQKADEERVRLPLALFGIQ